jgi:RNA polymerase sigma-70 factor (ECF subfamily)
MHADRSPAEEKVAAGAESDLLTRARAGDTAAFEALYRAYAGRVYAVCLRLAAHTGLAEELTQDTFVNAWKTLGEFRGDSAFSSWLHRIAVNAALFRSRTDRRRTLRIVSTDEQPDPAVEGTELSALTAIDLEQALRALPLQARAVFVLHEIEGYQHEEIGEMMNIAPGTSKAQLHRARARLKELLA